MQVKKRRPERRIRRVMEYLAVVGLYFMVRLVPFSLAFRAGAWLGGLVYRIDKKHRAITEENLRASFGDKSQEEVGAIARTVFENLGCLIVEFLCSDRYAKRPVEEYLDYVNYGTLDDAVKKGRGVLLLTGHCGNWELMAIAQSIKGPRITIVVRPLDNPYLEKAVSNLRTRFGHVLINKQKGMREVLRALGRGEIVGILLDQSVTKKEGVFVDFFGRPACTNKGLALLAAKTKAPVIPAFTRRVGLNRHEIIIGDEVLLVDTGDKDADIKANTQAYTKVIEDFIRKYPDQWFWMHRRWKTKLEDV
jgi:KDO2-lipid IV(A) lauroyltransferase